MTKNAYSRSSIGCVAMVACLTLANATQAQIPYPNSGTPVTTAQELFANGGDVTVTFLGKGGAGDTDLLFLFSPTPNAYSTAATPIFNNQSTPAGTTVDLGIFAFGTELIFGMNNASTGDTWFTGPASRNSDGTIHAYTVNGFGGDPNTTYVAFEDLPATGSDFNYQDVQYTFTGLAASPNPPTVPDATATLPLLGLGMAGLMAAGRRFRK